MKRLAQRFLKLTKKHTRVLIISFYVVAVLGVIYHLYFGNRLIPGVKIGNVKIGGLKYNQARELLVKNENTLTKELVLRYQTKEFTLKDTDIGLTYDWDGALTRAFEVGRTKNLITDTKEKLAGLFKDLTVPAYYDYEDEQLSNKLALVKAEINIEANDSGIGLSDKGFVVTAANYGTKVVDDALYAEVINSFDNLDFSPKTIPTKNVRARIKEEDVMRVYDDAVKVLSNSITLNYKDKKWLVGSDQLLNFLKFEKITDGKGDRTALRLNEPRFEAFTDDLAREVNELPRGRVTSLQGNKVVDFVISQPGIELDTKKFTNDFKQAFFHDGSDVELPMRNMDPAGKEQYGIFSLLGTGESKYSGSIPARIKNLSLATERTDGVLVAPGQIYSLNKAIGEISARTGYDSAYIIQNGRTVLGEGGGVCQVSTTMFRAALDAGLPIVMRYPHAYRVHYYEEDSPIGMDASIFQPSLDLQFKNDTPNYILVQTENDPANVALTYRIFGTPDGRTVEMSTPVISSQTPPPAPLYQDDPSLAKGVIRQIDFSAWGANVSFTRKVIREDKVLYDDTFVSRYAPWRAIFLVGTKE